MDELMEEVRAHLAQHEEWVRQPLPPRLHRCSKHIKRGGVIDGVTLRRCACGGMVFSDGIVLEKNSSRTFHKSERKARGL